MSDVSLSKITKEEWTILEYISKLSAPITGMFLIYNIKYFINYFIETTEHLSGSKYPKISFAIPIITLAR